MATWQDFSDLFETAFQPVITEINSDFDSEFEISDYPSFEAQSSSLISSRLASLDSRYTTPLAIATYFSAKAQGIPTAGDGNLTAWDLMRLGMAVDEMGAVKNLEDHLSDNEVDFAAFQALTPTAISAYFGGAQTSYGFWDSFVQGLINRTIILSDTEFGPFVLSLPLEERTSVEGFLQMVLSDDANFDSDALRAMSSATLAGKIQALNTNPHFRYRYSQQVILAARALIEENCPDNQFEAKFLSSLGAAMTAGMTALLSTLVKNTTIATAQDVAGLQLDTLVTTFGTLTGGHNFFHSLSIGLLNDLRDFDASLAEQNKIQYTPFTFQIKPSNSDARPLGGLMVKVTENTDPVSPVEIGTRMLDTSGIARIEYPGSISSALSLEFEVMDAELVTLVTSSSISLDLAAENTIEVTLAVPALPVNSAEISSLGLTIPTALDAYLVAQSISNLDDVRRFGGLAVQADSAVQDNLALAQEIDNHASLELISNDAALRTYLMTNGYTSAGKIAAKTRAEFVTELTATGFGEVTLAGVYMAASRTSAVLSHLVMAKGAGYASNYKGEAPLNPSLSGIFSKQCDCDECRSGVSPLAYLAALLDYGTKYIKNNSNAVDVDWFQSNFHQAYCELPANCAAVEKKVCQIRIAIEVMRQYMNSVDIPYHKRKNYLETTYSYLLNQAGVSLEEIRLVGNGTADTALLESMSDRMGIDPSQVASFYLDSTGTTPTLTEDQLELLFGFQSTLRNPYSDGLKQGDSTELVYNWQFEGTEWMRHTDAEGFLYLKISASTNEVYIYKADARLTTDLVGYGLVSAASPRTAEIVGQNDSGLKGRIELGTAYNSLSGSNSDVKVSVIPKLLAYRSAKQRLRWLESDWSSRNTYFTANRTLPIIEPDFMGPDDMRSPSEGSNGTIKPFDIWKNRRLWVDAIMAEFKPFKGLMGSLFDLMDIGNWSHPYQPIGGGTGTSTPPWNSFGISNFVDWPSYLTTLATDLQSTNLTTRSAAANTVTSTLHMPLDHFARLSTLLAQYQLNPTNPGFDTEEFFEIHNILCQAAKQAYYVVWITEENTNVIQFSAVDLWKPLFEAKEGEWKHPFPANPYYPSATNIALIDPVENGLLELPDPLFGAPAINLWQTRIDLIKAKVDDIYAAHTPTAGYDAMTDVAVGVDMGTMGGLSVSANYNFVTMAELLAALESSDATEKEEAFEVVNTILFLSETEFREAALTMKKEEEDGIAAVSEDEYKMLARLLSNGFRRKSWTTWRTAETSVDVDYYWQAYKQMLPKWRSSSTLRRDWLAALDFYNRTPMVDPDLIKPGDIVNPEFNNNVLLDNPAYVLYRDRDTELNGTSGWMSMIAAVSPNDNIENIIGVTGAEIQALWTLYQGNNDVAKRLAQLNLKPDRLALIAKLEGMSSGWSDGDWDAFCAIMLQIKKERNLCKWITEERVAGISLSPQFFRSAYQNYYEFFQYLDATLQPWRSNPAARRDWQEKLESRIDQAKTLVESVAGMVRTVEDRTLIMLRDALIKQSGAIGANLEEKGEYLTDHFLLDFKTQCCNETTRVAQAIETLQILFFSIRTGTMIDDYPLLEMRSDDWDDDWKWLGTYGTWRSLMFVYLYPENVLMPSLKDKMSGKLRGIMNNVRDAARFTPDMACEVMHDYEEYLKDMADLSLQATVTTTVHVEADGCGTIQGMTREMDFHFALGGHTKKVYYSFVDQSATSVDTAQSYWEELPQMEGIHRIIGATVFKTKNDNRYVYVFSLKSVKNDQPDLVANRLNLSTMRWEGDLEDLKIEKDSQMETWTAMLAEKENEEDKICIVGRSYEWLSDWSIDSSNHFSLTDDNGDTIKDRHVVYNFLDGNGTAWNSDDWNPLRFHWFHSFRLAGAIFTSESFLVVIAAIQFRKGDDFRLAYHPFYLGSNLRSLDHLRVIPQSNNNGIEVDSTEITNAGLQTLFVNYQTNSSKLRTPLAFSPSFERTIGILKGANNNEYSLYFNKENSSITEFFDFEISPSVYYPRTGNSTLGTVNSGAATYKWERSVDVIPTNSQANFVLTSQAYYAFFIGPCNSFAMNRALGGAPWRKALQINFGSNPILAGFGSQGFPVTNFPLNLHFSNVQLPALLQQPNASTSNIRATLLHSLFSLNAASTRVNRSYLEEAYYLLPIFVALELQKNKFYEEALEMYRLVYDFTLPSAKRKIFYGLVVEENITTSYANVMAWLDDPENPHTVAGMRANTYTRFTIFSIVRCMLEMADQEFTTDSPESVPRARVLYTTAIDLLNHEIYQYETQGCGALLQDLDVLVDDPGWYPEWIRLRMQIAGINNHDAIDAIVNGFSPYTGGVAAIFANNSLTWEVKIKQAEEIYQAKANALGSSPNRLCNVISDYSVEQNRWDLNLGDSGSGTEINRMSQQIGNSFLNNLALITGKTTTALTTEDSMPWLGEPSSVPSGEAIELSLTQRLSGEQGYYEAYYEANPMAGLRLTSEPRPFIPYTHHYFCVPQNPVPFNLLLHAELNLFKIRHCRNIAGVHRELDPYGAPTDTTSGMPVIGANGQISFPGTVGVAATPYRYEYVLARAKELVQLAAQAESGLLSTLEKRDAEAYNLLRARQDLSTAKATVRLQDLRVRASEHEVDLAEMQQDRAEVAVDNYAGWLSAGIPVFEGLLIDQYSIMADLQKAGASMGYAQQLLSLGMGTLSVLASEKNPLGGLAGWGYGILAATSGVLGLKQLENQSSSIALQNAMSINQIHASFEQRKRDWTFQKTMSEWDVKLAGQQIKLANDHLRITGQERAISQMQADHAAEVIDFLRTKFTNRDLYDWMSGVLQRVYSFYLQQASSMAKIAQQQLAFERQEAPANMILDDYWAVPSDSSNVPGVTADKGVDRKGLTGSARLQQDISKLDLYAFETEKRKLQLTKTMSMAQLFPAEFEVFRQTGVLNFRTNMQWFDRDFPGHYLRLIKRVRTSVIALVPPGEGIRARLSTTGTSRVIVGGDTFQEVVVRRGSESVSLTSPVEATGLFEMLPDRGEMLYPFEAMGVDAGWEFRMFKAANPINFNTIADVLLTFEYTALENSDYEQQIIRSFDQYLHGERAFSFKYLFPDQWYDLKNPGVAPEDYKVNFNLTQGDFPGLAELKIEHVTAMLITDEGLDQNPRNLILSFDDGNVSLGGVATTNTNGVASTRASNPSGSLRQLYDGNAFNWVDFLGKTPFGTWTLDCSDAENYSGSVPPSTLQEIIENGTLQDILLIVSYKGDSPIYYPQL